MNIQKLYYIFQKDVYKRQGQNFYANHNLVILDGTTVKIGDNVVIGPKCGIYTAGHPINEKQRNEGLEYAKKIIIGNSVWIGGNVTI